MLFFLCNTACMITYEVTATGPKGYQVKAISPDWQGARNETSTSNDWRSFHMASNHYLTLAKQYTLMAERSGDSQRGEGFRKLAEGYAILAEVEDGNRPKTTDGSPKRRPTAASMSGRT